MSRPDVLIAGAGLSGLACALALHKKGVTFQILEAASQAGGRLRTDSVGDFRLDRGFHLLLTASPEARTVFDYEALKLFRLEGGARVWLGSGFLRAGTIGGIRDKFRLSLMMSELRQARVEEVLGRPEMPAVDALRRRLISSELIDRMFCPWIGALVQDPKLGGSNRLFEFVFKMLLDGGAALPAGGMQALPDQLVARLPGGSIRYGVRAHSVTRNHVRLTTGERLAGEAVVVATDGPEAASMLPQVGRVHSRSLTCVYYAADEPPYRSRALAVDGLLQGIVSHVCVPSEVAPGYAPKGHSLISVSMPGVQSRDDQTLDIFLKDHLRSWYGSQVTDWRLLRVYRLEHFLPDSPAALDPRRSSRVAPGLYVCGDHWTLPTIHGALESGRRAAEELLAETGLAPDVEAA